MTLNLEYGDVLNNANVSLHAILSTTFDFYQVFGNIGSILGLTGDRCKNLVSKLSFTYPEGSGSTYGTDHYTYSYTTDNNGYVTKATCTAVSGSKKSTDCTVTVTYK